MNKKLIGIIIAVVLVLAFVFGAVLGINSKKSSTPLVSKDGVNLTLTEENLEEIKSNMNDSGTMTVDKRITEYDMGQDDIDLTTIDRLYLFQDQDKENNDWTAIDYQAILNDSEYDESNYDEILKKHKITIKESFGIKESDITKTSNFDILTKIIKFHGIDTNLLTDNTLDKDLYDEVYEQYGQKCYTFPLSDFDHSILKLNKGDYDNIIATRGDVITETYKDKERIRSVSIFVKYEKNESTYQRRLTLSFNFYDADNDMGCGCGSDTECGETTEDCDTGCDM